MLPVVSGEAETRRQIVIYTVVLALVCIALTPLGLGWIYLVSALVLNGIFLWFAIRLYCRAEQAHRAADVLLLALVSGAAVRRGGDRSHRHFVAQERDRSRDEPDRGKPVVRSDRLG